MRALSNLTPAQLADIGLEAHDVQRYAAGGVLLHEEEHLQRLDQVVEPAISASAASAGGYAITASHSSSGNTFWVQVGTGSSIEGKVQKAP